jgi:cytidine deaminase
MHKELNIGYEEYESVKELGSDDLLLLEAADKAVKSSYAPFSNFHVGAAVLLDNGKIILGSNQENSAYPSGLCAERVAVFSAMSEFPQSKIVSIAITAHSDGSFDDKNPTAPCGACRQVIIDKEFRDKSDIRCILRGNNGKVLVFHSFKDLLPFFFSK